MGFLQLWSSLRVLRRAQKTCFLSFTGLFEGDLVEDVSSFLLRCFEWLLVVPGLYISYQKVVSYDALKMLYIGRGLTGAVFASDCGCFSTSLLVVFDV